MGHGVNQRDVIKMTPEEVDAFLHERRAMSMCTINHDGSIHAVAMWYGFLDGWWPSRPRPSHRRSRTCAATPAHLLFEDGDSYEELRGVELVGRAEIIDDPDRIWELGVSVFERYYGSYTEEMRPFVEAMLHKRVAIKLEVERTVSWDHRKLGLPSTRPAGVKFSLDARRSPSRRRGLAPPTASPAFYEGRPGCDHIAVLEVVRHETTAERA